MELATVKTIVAGLLAWIGTHTTFEMPNEAPVVAIVPHAYLEDLACDRPCPVLGVYPDGGVVYIDEALSIDSNVCARSVLLHEIVHYVQDANGRYQNQHPIGRYRLREDEARAIQRIYLQEFGREVEPGARYSVSAFIGPSC